MIGGADDVDDTDDADDADVDVAACCLRISLAVVTLKNVN